VLPVVVLAALLLVLVLSTDLFDLDFSSFDGLPALFSSSFGAVDVLSSSKFCAVV
jgi:hypothetical protein